MEFAVNNGNIDAKSKLQELKKLKREWIEGRIRRIRKSNSSSDCRSSSMMMNQGCTITIIGNINRSRGRYNTQAPIGLEGRWNFYQYPLNPISGIDPLGISHLFIQYNFRYAFVCFRYTM